MEEREAFCLMEKGLTPSQDLLLLQLPQDMRCCKLTSISQASQVTVSANLICSVHLRQRLLQLTLCWDIFLPKAESRSKLKNDTANEAAWRQLNSSLHCSDNKMKLKAMGPGAADLQLHIGRKNISMQNCFYKLSLNTGMFSPSLRKCTTLTTEACA